MKKNIGLTCPVKNRRFFVGVGLIGLILALPFFVFAAGLVPCNGINCSFCDLFSLIQNIFNYVVYVLVPLIAVGGVVWGGYTYLTSAGSQTKVEAARGILKNTFIGLAVVYAAFLAASGLIGFLVKTDLFEEGGTFSFKKDGTFDISCHSSALVNKTGELLKNGKVTITVPDEESKKTGEVDFVRTGNFIEVGKIDLTGIRAKNPNALNRFSQAAADPELVSNNITLGVTSGYRSKTEQDILVAQNCSGTSCDPKTCIPANAEASNCPHVAGRALDVHGFNQNSQQCPNNSECQLKVIDVMLKNGFCVLDSEAWHFEYGTKVSPACKYQNVHRKSS